MGKALYREYRPKSLTEVIGQDHITKTLTNALKNNAVSHAYLFTGPRGVGKTSIARIWAHEINGIDYDEDATHLDIIEIDAASNRRIDEMRELRDKVHISPTSAKYKVYIIDEVHMLTREAFNALLKTLEEPPEHAVFILATTEVHKVPDTIISRTQRFSFKPIPVPTAVNHLRSIADKENIKIENEALKLLAEHGQGSFRDSISMLDQIAGFGHATITTEDVSTLLGVPSQTVIESILNTIPKGDSSALFDQIYTLKELGVSPSKAAQSFITLLRTQLTNENTVLSPSKTISLMRDLLPLTGTTISYDHLEITLLAYIVETQTLVENDKTEMNQPSNSKHTSTKHPISASKAPTTTSPKSTTPITVTNESKQKTHEEPVGNPNEISSEKDKTTTIPSSTTAAWQNILDTIKKTHNTLYGMLRLVAFDMAEDTITLTFNFEFHRKQMQTTKNLQLLSTVVTDTLGKKYKIDMKVKKTSPTDKITNKEQPADTLSNISNIFDGAELLES